jgi:hypothetical protein
VTHGPRFVVVGAGPWTFDRFREEMSRPTLEHYELVS